jgi:hypothetical protein
MFPIAVSRAYDDEEFGSPAPKKKPRRSRTAKPNPKPKPRNTSRGGRTTTGLPSQTTTDPNEFDNYTVRTNRQTSPNVQPERAPGRSSWLSKILDAGVAIETIRAQAAQAKQQALQQTGQTISDDEALQIVAAKNNVPLGSSVGNQTGFAIDGVLGWLQQNFLVVAIVGLGVFLLFRQPPGQKR